MFLLGWDRSRPISSKNEQSDKDSLTAVVLKTEILLHIYIPIDGAGVHG